jgi:uncharacterized protein (DUF58 family)
VLRSLTFRIVVFWGLAGAVAGALVGSRALVVGALAALLLGAVVVYTRRHIFDRLSHSRSLPRRVVGWGSEIEVRHEVANRKWLPVVWLRVRDRWPAAVEPVGFTLRAAAERGTGTLVQDYSVRWWERVSRRHRGVCRERGVHAFGPAFAEAGDPFGVASVERELPAVDQLVVLPKVLAAPGLPLLVGRPQVDAPSRLSLAHDPVELVGARPYRPGDPLRVINWRATARRQRLVSNRFEPTVTAQALIALNLRTVRYLYEGFDAEVMDLLCVVGASLAAGISSLGFAVGLLSNAHLANVPGGVAVDPAPGVLDEVLETLARVVLFPPSPFEGLLGLEAMAPRDSTDYVVVTAMLDEQLAPVVAALKREATTHVVFVGEPPTAYKGLVDRCVGRDLDWRTADELPLA